jgi:hypothetical protein
VDLKGHTNDIVSAVFSPDGKKEKARSEEERKRRKNLPDHLPTNYTNFHE